MDPRAFESCFGEIAALSEPQRRRAWQALALSETAGSPAIETRDLMIELAALGAAATVAEPQPARPLASAAPSNRVSTASVAELGQRRVDSVGCPHCDNRDVVRWGHASDLPRYRCKASSRTFNALTKTSLANLRMKDKWASEHARGRRPRR